MPRRCKKVKGYESRRVIRNSARAFEQALDPGQRKRLGQFFTGVPLGKLLAHTALRKETRLVLDPMAGHGDLLDATWEAAVERGFSLERLDGIEIDVTTADRCRNRLASLIPKPGPPECSILAADAFDPAKVGNLPARSYDLVITNPPFVRYQARKAGDLDSDPARGGLKRIVDDSRVESDAEIWRVLVENYSGLADLSVPATLLAGYLVRPGGRLALVVPATWRSRNYADVIRYMFLRCFRLETIVADTPPGWFSDALVRTHLIIARRLSARETRQPLVARKDWPQAKWVRVEPHASNQRSLVGAAFDDRYPEAEFAAWIDERTTPSPSGINVRSFDLIHEWAAIGARISRHHWFEELEGSLGELPLFSEFRESAPVAVPEVLRDALPTGAGTESLVPLEATGIKVGQGLRTGCNAFFYVIEREPSLDGSVRVMVSKALGGTELTVPSTALRPVLRRQSDLRMVECGEVPPGRVLDLRDWVLPEDAQAVMQARSTYIQNGANVPQVMPVELAAHVRHAACVSLDGPARGQLIPELSAVRTNVRRSGRSGSIPRFWYMLPDFTTRHLPDAFAPRVNQGTPWIECNTEPQLLIDANFSTLWAPDRVWSRFALKALLNSVWCRAMMEALGTPLGGGALKLEAAHLRQMPVPVLTRQARESMDALGRKLSRNSVYVQAQIDRIVLSALLRDQVNNAAVMELADRIALQTSALSAARQRGPS